MSKTAFFQNWIKPFEYQIQSEKDSVFFLNIVPRNIPIVRIDRFLVKVAGIFM